MLSSERNKTSDLCRHQAITSPLYQYFPIFLYHHITLHHKLDVVFPKAFFHEILANVIHHQRVEN